MMAKQVNKKLVDSNESVSSGGRAEYWWLGRPVKQSSRYEGDQYPGKLDQFEIIKKYSLKGFEYGNWLNNNDRFDFLQATAESLVLLSGLLKTKNLGCDGTIGIAFGARGHSGAKAHFEPTTFMINLTKYKGYDSLAHEYGHALDYFFGLYVDQYPGYTSLVGGVSERRVLVVDGGSLRNLANKVVNTITTGTDGKTSETYMRLISEHGTDGGYWFRRNEIFARAFEQWVQYKLSGKKIKNTFLVKKNYTGKNYIAPADFKRVLPLMDKLIAEMGQFMNNKKKSTGVKRPKMKIAAKKK